jgi:hypothetical protein
MLEPSHIWAPCHYTFEEVHRVVIFVHEFGKNGRRRTEVKSHRRQGQRWSAVRLGVQLRVQQDDLQRLQRQDAANRQQGGRQGKNSLSLMLALSYKNTRSNKMQNIFGKRNKAEFNDF